ncbi:MAG: DUF5716 family protein [Eubacterium sp.]
MGKGVILGIDFSMDFTQLAYLDDEGNPQSICVGTEDNFMIPTVVCYNSELKEWSAGEEAVNKGRLEKSQLYKELPSMLNGDDNEELTNIMSAYMSYLLKLAVNYCNGRLIKNILITVDDVTPAVIEGLTKTFVTLGYAEDDIKIISHSESFVYYVLNQNKDIWINNVYFLNFNRHGFVGRRLNVIKGKPPHVVDVSVENLDELVSMKMLKQSAEAVDQILADHMEEKLKKYVVSGIYLSGEGFYTDGWEKTLSVMCRNRRVFKGNNLIVKGAAYGAKEFFYTPSLDQYLISCKGRTRVKVTMAVKHKEREKFITLSNIGDYWYQARSKAECILENPAEAVFEIHDIMNHRNETFKIDLTGFPTRPPKTTRIEINFKYVSENKFEIEIRDLGFGEFFKSSGMSVKKEITIE